MKRLDLQHLTQVSAAIATLTFSMSALSQGQTAPRPTGSSSPASTEQAPLEEVVVSSRKRLETAQTVPIAVSAFNADTLDRAKITGAIDLQFSIPNAVLTGNDRFTIRGIGNNSLGGDNGVGVALNGAPIPVYPQNELYDLERIEVLRGPQGTLFGRNTTGGALAIFTKRPTANQEGTISVEVGNFNHRRTEGMLNIPVSDNVRQRFSGYVLKRDGFTQNEFTGNAIDGRDQYSLRSSTRIFIGDRTELNVVLSSYREDSSRTRESKRLCKASPVLGCSPNELGFDSPDYNATLFRSLAGPLTSLGFVPAGSNIYAGAPNPQNLRAVAADFDATFKLQQNAATMELAHELKSGTLTYVGGFSNSSSEQNTDWDNSALPFRFSKPITYNAGRDLTVTTDRLITTDSFTSREKTSTHEVRFASKATGPFSYTTGLFALQSEGGGGFFTWHPFFELIQKVQGRPPETWFVNTETLKSTTKAHAWFGEGQWKLSDGLRATLGARWTKEERTTNSRSIILTNTVPFTEKPKLDWSWWTGRASIDYTPRKDLMYYASIATGYKGGGFNTSSATRPTFDPETVTSYEAGIKSELLNGKLRANFSVFHNDYKDMQLAQRISAAAITANADAKISGAEAELLFAPTRTWLLDANVSFLNTKIGEFLTSDAANPAQSLTTRTPLVLVNLAGRQLPHSPRTKVKLGAQYTAPLMNTGWTATARMDHVWQDSYYAREFNTPTDLIQSWSITNLQLGFTNPKGNIHIRSFVKNVSNSNNITNIIIEDALVGSYRNARLLDPRTVGVRVEYRF